MSAKVTPRTSLILKPIIFCTACLTTSVTRKMYPIDNISLFTSITKIYVPKNSDLKVCWECKAVLEKINKFRQKAVKAHKTLSKNVKKTPTPLTTLVHINNNWLSIADQPEIDPLSHKKATPRSTSFNVEIIESETLKSVTQDTYSIEQDPFSLGSEVEVKEEDLINKDEQNCLDILKCEYESSSDDEPFKNTVKAKTHLEIISHQTDDNSDTDSAAETSGNPKPSSSKTHTYLKSVPSENISPSIPRTKPLQKPLSVRVYSDSTRSLDLPLAFVASSLLTNSFMKPAESTTKGISQEQEKPVQYHTGPKLFKNSPQLAIPEMFRNTEPPIQPMYEVKRLTQKEVDEYRAEKMKCARDRVWERYCEKCLVRFVKQRDYEDHFKKHEESAGPFMCTVCELRFPTQNELHEHKEEAHYTLYFCSQCKEKFYNKRAVLRHNTLYHEDVLKFCKRCDMRFTNNKDYYMHNKTHVEMQKCQFCDKVMKSFKLLQHIKNVHAPKPKMECHICRKVVEGKMRLINHIKAAHKPKEDGAYCVDCDVLFKTKALYHVHLKSNRKHRNQPEEFACPQCDKKFPTKYFRTQHINVYHESQNRLQCDYCKRLFLSKRALRSHIMSRHLKLKPEKRDKMCDICGKAFMNSACLREHRNSHLNIRPYKCGECDATFNYSGARYMHLKLKHGKKKKNES